MSVRSASALPTREETDRKMLEWLSKQVEHFSKGGGNRHFADAAIARFAELIVDQTAFKHSLTTLQDAHKLAMTQMQFAQSVVKQLERNTELLDRANGGGHKSLPSLEPAVELKGN